LLIPIFGGLLLGAGLGVVGASLVEPEPSPPPAVEITSTAPVLELTDGLSDASLVADRAIPSVVTVEVAGPAGQGSGSGVVYDASGRILTNHHVVEVGTRYRVVLSDGRTYGARLLGSDPFTDLAVLEIDARGVPAIELGATGGLEVGAPAIAVGSPLGLDGGPSLSVGVISSLERIVRTQPDITLYGMLQTDAPITQGSSGGALVDSRGRLIGITTAVGVSSVGVEGIGFATPVEIVERVADEIIATGVASQPILGITGQTAYAPTGDGGEQPTGVTVLTVGNGSPAADAGLAIGDTITSVEGVPIHTMETLIAQLRRYPAGSSISVSLDGTDSLTITLGDRA
jgi:putative serine protease PepD